MVVTGDEGPEHGSGPASIQYYFLVIAVMTP
jgi:hypothetical protein